MSKNSWYSIKTTSIGPNVFECVKADADQEYETTYHLAVSHLETDPNDDMIDHVVACTCYAGNKTCRHKKMLNLFRQLGRIDSGWRYQYDTNKWAKPINME